MLLDDIALAVLAERQLTPDSILGAAVSVALVAIMFVTLYIYMRFVLGKTDRRRAALV